MRPGSSVDLELANEDGLQGWRCRICRGQKITKIGLKLKKDSKSLVFQPTPLRVPETIYWCVDKTETSRSNQVVVRSTGELSAILCSMFVDTRCEKVRANPFTVLLF